MPDALEDTCELPALLLLSKQDAPEIVQRIMDYAFQAGIVLVLAPHPEHVTEDEIVHLGRIVGGRPPECDLPAVAQLVLQVASGQDLYRKAVADRPAAELTVQPVDLVILPETSQPRACLDVAHGAARHHEIDRKDNPVHRELPVGIGSIDRHVVFMKGKGLAKESPEVAPTAILVHRQKVVETIVHCPAQGMVVGFREIGIAAVPAGFDLPFEVLRDVEAKFRIPPQKDLVHERGIGPQISEELLLGRVESNNYRYGFHLKGGIHRRVQEGTLK